MGRERDNNFNIFYSTTRGMYGDSSVPCYSLTCKTLVLYHSGPLMYVYVSMHTNEMFYHRGERDGVRDRER